MRPTVLNLPGSTSGAADHLSRKFQRAIDCLQRGKLESARALCDDILKRRPKHAGALHVAGLVALRAGHPRRAIELIDRALTLNPTDAAAHCNRAAALQALGELAAALEGYSQAIVCDPEFAEAYCNRGIVLGLLNRPDDAVASLSRAIGLRPDFAAAYYHRGLVLQGLGRWESALASYDRAIAAEAGHSEACFNRGVVLQALNRADEALASYDRAIAINPRFAEAHSNRGVALHELNRLPEALASCDRAIAINPRHAEAYCNRGNLLRRLERWDAALASYDAAIDIWPDCAVAHCNRGNVLSELNQPAAAVACYDRAIEIDGRYVEAYCNKAVAQLLAGDFEDGWRNYEWRRQRQPRTFSQPSWQPDVPLAGQTILLHAEQGFGDTLQFCRYVPLVSALGGQVILEVPRPLKTLLANLGGVSQLVATGDALPAFDYQCPLMSLPLAFNTRIESIPAPSRYLSADAARVGRWRAKLGEANRPRIGLVWSGSAVRNNNRTIALAEWMQHLPQGFDYVCLQKEIPPPDRGALRAGPEILDVAGELEDFGDTAALCECLDLVISIDTSVAHLSGALGRKTWILLPFNPDWRWLLGRADSPWYPTAALYRQERLGDWRRVFERVRADLLRTFRAA
jgi:tetratricopeptide (TPR) repeat protein